MATHKTILRFTSRKPNYALAYKISILSTCYLFLPQSNISQFHPQYLKLFLFKHQVQSSTISFSIKASQFSGSLSSASISYQSVSAWCEYTALPEPSTDHVCLPAWIKYRIPIHKCNIDQRSRASNIHTDNHSCLQSISVHKF